MVFETIQSSDDRLVALPVARRLAASTVHDEFFRLFRHLRIEIVHQHSLSGFLNPSLCRSRVAARRSNWGTEFAHRTTSSSTEFPCGFDKVPSLKKLDAPSIDRERTQSSRHAGTRPRKRALTSSSAAVLVSPRRSNARVAASNSIATTILASATA